MKILLLNGPNLGRLGRRQPEIYGSTTLAEIEAAATEHAARLGHTLVALQSNHEGVLIDRIEERDFDAIIINAGALVHHSYVLHDALADVPGPVIEIHISDIRKRETWRRVSVIEAVVTFQIMGHGWQGYLEAIDYLHEHAAEHGTDDVSAPAPAPAQHAPAPALEGSP